jgi:hypothetical protein
MKKIIPMALAALSLANIYVSEAFAQENSIQKIVVEETNIQKEGEARPARNARGKQGEERRQQFESLPAEKQLEIMKERREERFRKFDSLPPEEQARILNERKLHNQEGRRNAEARQRKEEDKFEEKFERKVEGREEKREEMHVVNKAKKEDSNLNRFLPKNSWKL